MMFLDSDLAVNLSCIVSYILYIVCLPVVSSADVDNVCFDINKFSEFKQGQKLVGSSYLQYNKIGLMKCVDHCQKDDRCSSVNYEHRVGTCQLNIYNSEHKFAQIENDGVYTFYDVRNIQHPNCDINHEVLCESDWMTVFRGTPGIGDVAYDSYLNKNNYYTKTTVDFGCYFTDVNITCKSHYRNPYLDKWDSTKLEEVKLSLYKNGVEDKFLVFDAADTNFKSWFSQEKLLQSSWTDLNRQPTAFMFSIDGAVILSSPDNVLRSFYIQQTAFGTCPADEVWMLIRDYHDSMPNIPCLFDQVAPFPQFIYSRHDTKSKLNSEYNRGHADVLLIAVKFKSQ